VCIDCSLVICWFASKSGSSKKIREIFVKSGKIIGKDRFLRRPGKIREVLSFLLFYFRAMTSSILGHTSNGLL